MSPKRRRKQLEEGKNRLNSYLTPEENLYAELRATGLLPEDAYKLAFRQYDLPPSAVRSKAAKLERDPNVVARLQQIHETLKARIIEEAPAAFERLVELSKFARSEKVRLDATRDILDRAGFKEPVQLQTFNVFAVMSPEQIKELLRVHMTKLALEMTKKANGT